MFQTSLPVSASTRDGLAVERVVEDLARRQYAAPRLTMSQQATPWPPPCGLGSYFHLIGAPGLAEVERVQRCSGTA